MNDLDFVERIEDFSFIVNKIDLKLNNLFDYNGCSMRKTPVQKFLHFATGQIRQ